MGMGPMDVGPLGCYPVFHPKLIFTSISPRKKYLYFTGDFSRSYFRPRSSFTSISPFVRENIHPYLAGDSLVHFIYGISKMNFTLLWKNRNCIRTSLNNRFFNKKKTFFFRKKEKYRWLNSFYGVLIRSDWAAIPLKITSPIIHILLNSATKSRELKIGLHHKT